MNLLLALAKAARWGGGVGRTGQGSSLHHTQQMGSGHGAALAPGLEWFCNALLLQLGVAGIYISVC